MFGAADGSLNLPLAELRASRVRCSMPPPQSVVGKSYAVGGGRRVRTS